MAALAVVGLGIAGNLRGGFALGAGLAIGAGNGLVASRALDTPIGFQVSSLIRLTLMTMAAIVAALLIGLDYAWLVLMGVAAAQLTLVAVAARSLLR